MNMLCLLPKVYTEQNISCKYLKNLEAGHCDGCTWCLKQANHTLLQFPKGIKAWAVVPGCSSSRKPAKEQSDPQFFQESLIKDQRKLWKEGVSFIPFPLYVFWTQANNLFSRNSRYIRSLESRGILSGSHDAVGESPMHFYVSSLCVFHSALILSQFSFVWFFLCSK